MEKTNELVEYFGVKGVRAKPLSIEDFRQEIRDFKYDGEEQEGYMVVYKDDYISWSPKTVFEEAYSPTNNMDFTMALTALKLGNKVARHGWNGTGMWVKLIDGNNWSTNVQTLEGFRERLSWLGLNTVNDKFVPWTPSTTDLLAEDWTIV